METAVDGLRTAGLIASVEQTKRWSLTDLGARRLSDRAEWLIRCSSIFTLSDDLTGLRGVLQQGIVNTGDWFHDGRGTTGRVCAVDAFDEQTREVGFVVEVSEPLAEPIVLRRWEPAAGAALWDSHPNRMDWQARKRPRRK